MKIYEITAAITALSNAIACGLSVTELARAAAIFVQIGDTLATIAAERALLQERNEKAE